MKTKDVLHLAATGLLRRKTRTLLTISGVIIGTVCIVLMFAIGLSNYRQFNETVMANQSLTQITVSSDTSTSFSAAAGITDSTIQQIAAIEHVKAASPQIDLPVVVKTGKYTAGLNLTGIDPAVLELKLQEGGMFEMGGTMPEVVLSADGVRQFIDRNNPPDYMNYEEYQKYVPEIDFLNTEMDLLLGYETDDPEMPHSIVYRTKVSGIQQEGQNEQAYRSYIGLDTARRILMDNRELAAKLNLSPNAYRTAVVVADDMSHVETVLEEVKKLGFQTYSPTEWITQMREEQSRQQGQLLAIGFISLFVSAIGIANTMYANILERRRDIGVMKVVGMKIKKIRQLFLTESALIGLLGGSIGVGISYIVMLIINTGTGQTSFLGMYFTEGMKIEIPAWLAAGALLIAVGVGAVSGLYPAKQATRMSPLEAMRNGK